MPPARDEHVSRRAFLQGTLLTGAALTVPLFVTACARDGGVGEYAITDWISVHTSGQVVLGVSQPELGQGSYTALPQILADELDADWKSVVVRFVTGKEAYGVAFQAAALYDAGLPVIQTEGGSMSTTKLYHRLRVAGAQARDVLIRAACLRWGHAEADCSTHQSFVIDTKSGKRLSYGELARSAARLPIDPYPPLKGAAQFRMIGEPVHRLDAPAKCDGSAVYGIDVTVPDMLNAAIRIAPTFTGVLRDVRNEVKVGAMPGVQRIVKFPNAVAVAADKFWQARRAVDALDVEFDPGAAAELTSARIDALWQQALDGDTAVMVMNQGDARSVLAQHTKGVIERRFHVPHIAHAPMEPVNATVHVKPDAVEVWGPIQSVDACEKEVARALGRPLDQIRVHVTYVGGSFGRKIVPDFVVQAALVAREVGRPVKLLRTREEDLQHDLYRPNAACRLRAVVDARGYPLAVHARVCGQSLLAATRPSLLTRTQDGAWDESMVEGLYNQEYRVPNLFVEAVDTPLPVPLYFLRSAGSTAAVFFWESFVSDLAYRASIDPYRYRRELLAHDPAATKVLDAAAAAAQWQRPAAPNVTRGIAYHCYVGRGGAFRTHVAQVAEVERTAKGFAIQKITCAVDAGLVINPSLVKAQIEGGIGFALTTALKSRITFSNGRVDQANFPDYPLLSMAEMPQIVSVLVDSERPPQGVGEVVLAPVAPAVAGAVLQASGRRIDAMPFPADLFAR
jgi:isoquinoline 1-oxidoreductase subunit beta